MKTTKTAIWDDKDKTIRGWFICLIITMAILILIIIGAFDDAVAERLERMDALIGTFFAATFAVWRIGKAIEYKKENKEEE